MQSDNNIYQLENGQSLILKKWTTHNNDGVINNVYTFEKILKGPYQKVSVKKSGRPVGSKNKNKIISGAIRTHHADIDELVDNIANLPHIEYEFK